MALTTKQINKCVEYFTPQIPWQTKRVWSSPCLHGWISWHKPFLCYNISHWLIPNTAPNLWTGNSYWILTQLEADCLGMLPCVLQHRQKLFLLGLLTVGGEAVTTITYWMKLFRWWLDYSSHTLFHSDFVIFKQVPV